MEICPPGPLDAVTDIAGVRVGHATRDEPGWLTGTTVVVPPEGTVAGIDVGGGAPGTRETELLEPRHAVATVDAVTLSGGSAYGLGTADGVMAGLADAGRGLRVGAGEDELVPIVPTLILFDLGRGGGWRHHPGPAEGRAALAAATTGPVAQGGVGAGTASRAGGLRGGVGTASAVLPDGTTVAALVVCNALGSPVSADGSLLAAPLLDEAERAALPTPTPERTRAYWGERAAETAAMRARTATSIGVVATDATLDKAGCQMLARVAHDGLARALSPVHTAFDGDALVALATGARERPDPMSLVTLQTEAARCVSRAVVHALLAAEPVDRTADGGAALPSYRSALCG